MMPAPRDVPNRDRTGRLVLRHPSTELDRHHPQYVSPVRLVLEDLAQLRLGGLPGQEEVQRLANYRVLVRA